MGNALRVLRVGVAVWFGVAAVAALLAGPVRVAAAAAGDEKPAFDPPTEAEVRQTIEKSFRETYGRDNGLAKAEKVQIEFGAVKVGELTKKQTGRGEEARPVYPVKAEVTVTVTYSNGETRKVERGKESRDVFFFYKDAFKEWNYRTGSL